jgi:hypothetical protein
MMDFKLSENQEMVATMVRDFAEQNIRPKMMEWDESQEFPAELFHKMGELGLMGILVPQKYGGAGFKYTDYVTALTEIGRVCGSICLSVAAHNSLCTGHILQHANEAQKERWLPKLASGEWIGAWGLTEHNTGSDAGGMATTATQEGDDWVINGAKNFITHGITGDIAVVIVRTGEKGDSKGMTAFVVERGTPGFLAGKKENKLGMRASETAEMVFQDCRIPDTNRLGEVGQGFVQAMKVLDGGRISIAAVSLGIAKGALDCSIKYAKERVQFGKPIAHFQGIAFKLADMATEYEAAELMTMHAADMKDHGENVTLQSAMAKYFASEVCVRNSTEAVQIHGGYGYIKDFPAEKFYRDSKLCTIGEGTSEIQKLVISKNLLK